MTNFDILLNVANTTIVHVDLTVNGITTERIGIALDVHIINKSVGAPRSVDWGSVAWSSWSGSVSGASSPWPTVVVSISPTRSSSSSLSFSLLFEVAGR